MSTYRQILEADRIYDKQRKISKLDNGEIAIPINSDGRYFLEADKSDTKLLELQTLVMRIEMMKTMEKPRRTVYEKLINDIKILALQKDIEISDSLLADVPSHWERHKDLIVFPDKFFVTELWEDFGGELWTAVAESLGVKRLALKSTVTRDGYRTPQVKLLKGNDGWVKHTDNGIVYTFDITKCMFSAGNITEKIRVGKLNCAGETVVDLYAGIGYFVLPYLVHANASVVHACEWNEHALNALRRNLQLNYVERRCVIHHGDNRKLSLRSVADRVNLGLIPSSEEGWPVACALLKHCTGGWLHIHGNVTSGKVASQESQGCSSDASQDCSKLIGEYTSGSDASQDCSKLIGEYTSSSDASLDCSKLTAGYTCNKQLKPEWQVWSDSTTERLKALLQTSHCEQGVQDWKVTVRHLEHLKSYAPHVDHLVLDVECRPIFECPQPIKN